MKHTLVCIALLTSISFAQTSKETRQPIIDMHLHALPADWNGPPPQPMCTGQTEFVPADPREGVKKLFDCPSPFLSPKTDDELMTATIAELERFNIIAVTSGPQRYAQNWKAAAPHRIIPGLFFSNPSQITPDSVHSLFQSGEFTIFGEVVTQYAGLSPSDTMLDGYFRVAEELDIPVGIHMGLGPPGAAYIGLKQYRASLSNPLLLENMLLRHPKLRVWVMHAGWPMLDEMIHLLYSHPQVYVDLGLIDYLLPRKEFHYYLRRLVDAGFGTRIMFGTDQMNWPQTIQVAIDAIESAEFLTARQKRDIFYNNAARFLRLDSKEKK